MSFGGSSHIGITGHKSNTVHTDCKNNCFQTQPGTGQRQIQHPHPQFAHLSLLEGAGGVISSYGIAIMSTSLGRAACLRDAWQLTLQDRGCLVRAACIGSHAFWPQPSMAALRHHRLSSRFCSCSTCSVVEDYFQGVFNLPSCTSVRRATSEQRAHV